MNILVIMTGGTIGSAITGEYISPNGEQGSALLKMYEEYERNPVHFDCVSPYTILSENLNGSHISRLAECIRTYIGKKAGSQNAYDGIIITHGTDTLQYTAAGLYHLFHDCGLPIVLVSSNYVLDDARANGFANFAAAVSFIRQKLGTGVYVSYQNNSTEGELGPVYIHYGNRLLPHVIYSDDIHSVNDGYFCKILPQTSGEAVSYDAYEFTTQPSRPDARDSVFVGTQSFTITDAALPECSGILMLYVAPGMYYPEPSGDMKAILLITYHSGTLPTDNDRFCHFVKQAHALGIPVYVLGTSGDNLHISYESTALFEELHLRLLPTMSPAEAYIMLYSN